MSMAVPFGHLAGESNGDDLRLVFDRRIKLQFHSAKLNSDGGPLLFRELDEALGLTEMAGWELRDRRRGRNTQHNLLDPGLDAGIGSRGRHQRHWMLAKWPFG